MIIMNPGYEILTPISIYGTIELMDIEEAARASYDSEDRIKDQAESAILFVRKRLEEGHDSILEHSSLRVRFICDRGVSHELVRHRLMSWTQESTRYCNYSMGRYDYQIKVIEPCFLKPGSDAYTTWFNAMGEAEKAYLKMIGQGCKPEEARSVLPNSLKTKLVGTGNYREWRHMLMLRTAPDAHPQMRELMLPLLKELHERLPVIFDDIFERRFETHGV